jgi:hypothetical protein
LSHQIHATSSRLNLNKLVQNHIILPLSATDWSSIALSIVHTFFAQTTLGELDASFEETLFKYEPPINTEAKKTIENLKRQLVEGNFKVDKGETFRKFYGKIGVFTITSLSLPRF